MPPAKRTAAKKAAPAAKTAAEKAKEATAPPVKTAAPTAPPPAPAPQAPPPPPATPPPAAPLTVSPGENVTVEGQTIDPATANFIQADPRDESVPPAVLAPGEIPAGLVPHDVNGDTTTWLRAEKEITVSFLPRGVKRRSEILLVANGGVIARQALAERLAMYADAEALEVK